MENIINEEEYTKNKSRGMRRKIDIRHSLKNKRKSVFIEDSVIENLHRYSKSKVYKDNKSETVDKKKVFTTKPSVRDKRMLTACQQELELEY